MSDNTNNTDIDTDIKNITETKDIEVLFDNFWLIDYRILFYKERLTDFFPTIKMTLIEKLNAVFRLSIYLSILLYLITNNYQYIYIMIIVGGFTCFIYYTQKKKY